jgi:hypothetical protein
LRGGIRQPDCNIFQPRLEQSAVEFRSDRVLLASWAFFTFCPHPSQITQSYVIPEKAGESSFAEELDCKAIYAIADLSRY